MDEYNEPISPTQAYTNPPSPKQSDNKPLIAGILLILAGVMALIMWIFVFTIDYGMILDQAMIESQNVTISPEQIQSMMGICATIGALLSIFPIIGGILALQKKLWGGALACSIIGLFIVGPIFISSIFCLVSLILLIISKEQFFMQEGPIDPYS